MRVFAPFGIALAASLLTACDAPATVVQDPKTYTRELHAAAKTPELTAFYEAREWRPAWTTRSAEALVEALHDAERHGLDEGTYLRLIPEEDGPARDAGLTRAALAYGKALAFGATDPKDSEGLFTLARNEADLSAQLGTALETRDVRAWLAGLPPQDDEYRALSEAYLAWRARTGEAHPSVPAGKLLKPGLRDARVTLIAAALRDAGYFRGEAEGNLYTEELADAAAAFQAANGLNDDRLIGAKFLEMLNAGPDDRAAQLAVNLERRRWLARIPPPTRIDVNIPAATMVYYENGEAQWRGKVVVGQPSWETPSLGTTMTGIVVNPPWTVPEKIARTEILPKGGNYMAGHNMTYDAQGRIVQDPGPDSALGVVKFDLDNPYSIYLHDTPSKSFFAQAERQLSHGCIRVDNAVDFGRFLAARFADAQAFEDGLASGATRTIALNQQIPVRILYHTAFVDEAGEVVMRRDVYGRDKKLAALLKIPAAPAKRDERGGSGVAAMLAPALVR